jgi:hypothetical protein
LPLSGLGFAPFCCPARSQSLYRLIYQRSLPAIFMIDVKNLIRLLIVFFFCVRPWPRFPAKCKLQYFCSSHDHVADSPRTLRDRFAYTYLGTTSGRFLLARMLVPIRVAARYKERNVQARSTLESWVRMEFELWMSVSVSSAFVLSCVCIRLVTGLLTRPRSPTNCQEVS